MSPKKPDSSTSSDRHRQGTSLAGLLSAMRASILARDFGVRLELEPMHAAALMDPWSRLASPTTGNTLLLPDPAVAPPARAEAAASLASVVQRLGIKTHGRAGERGLVLTSSSMKELVAVSGLNGHVAVMIEGPVEAADAAAISLAMSSRQSPLAADVRAVAAMRITGDRTAYLDLRDRYQAFDFVAEAFRLYLAGLRHAPAWQFAPPEPVLVERLLDRHDRISVRPIETAIYSTSIDVGVCTSSAEAGKPADASLIYDIYTDSWHGD